MAEGRDPKPASLDQPALTQGGWVRDGGVVIERTFADALDVSTGDRITLNGRPFTVTGIAVTAASPPYPNLCDTGCQFDMANAQVRAGAGPGLIWLTQADARSLESLRQLAKLRSWETGAVLALMPEAFRSIGFDPAPAEEEFTARCQAALDIVQRDLDVTGYGRYRVRAHLLQWPTTVFAALPDGSYWSGAWA